LNCANASEVVEVAADLVVGGACWECGLVDQKIGLVDIGGRDVVAEEKDDNGGLGVVVLAQDCATESSQELGSRGNDGRLLGWRLGIELLVEEVVVEVGLCGERVECAAVVLSYSVDQSG
jgi:hypothetical protein